MRKVLAFGAGRGFIETNEDVLKRHGYELLPFRKGLVSGPGTSVLLVFAGGIEKREMEALNSLVGSASKPHIVFITPDKTPPTLRAVKRAAKFSLPEGFSRKELMDALGACSDVIGLHEKLECLKNELKIKSTELSSVLDIGKTLASSFDLPKVLAKIMERMRIMVDAETWAVMLMEEADRELVLRSARAAGGRKVKVYRLKPGEGIAGWCAADREPKIVHDVTREKRFSKVFDRATGFRTRSVMAVPITGNDKLLGVIELVNKSGDAGFTGGDLELVTRLLDQMSIAIERASMYQKMADLVITDDLTKLFNLRYLDRTLEVEVERAMRYSLAVTLIFMDIDFFKKVNDRYGHLTGSKLLVEISQLLLRHLRKVDIVARYGGDEFVIVLPQTDIPAAKVIAERLRKGIERHTFLRQQNLALKLTASFGIASYPAHAGNKEELLRLADEAMYRVKYHTRNNVYVFEK